MTGTPYIPFDKPLETYPRRADCSPLLLVGDIYMTLCPLQPGDRVPPHCYICDYDTGTIPQWTVLRRSGDDVRFVLVLIDPNALPKAEEPEAFQVACNVIATPSTVLLSPFYVLKEGYGPPGMACSLPQQAWCLVRGKVTAQRRRRS